MVKNKWNASMKKAWEILWDNSVISIAAHWFVKRGGIQLACICCNRFGYNKRVLATLSNCIESGFEEYFLSPNTIEMYMNILQDKTELAWTYEACSALSFLLADNSLDWPNDIPSRDTLSDIMMKTMQAWNLHCTLNLRLNTFKDYVPLLKAFHAPAAQYWVIWTIRYFTYKDKARYCPMLKDADGIQALVELCSDCRPSRRMKTLAEEVIAASTNKRGWQNKHR